MVPDLSPVVSRKYWRVVGVLLALTLRMGESVTPVSPAVIYALLSNVQDRSDPMAPMDLSLELIRSLQGSQAGIVLPWMIVAPGQDWKTLQDSHRDLLRQMITDLDIDVSRNVDFPFRTVGINKTLQSSKVSTVSVEAHTRWTAVIVTSALLGGPLFFTSNQFKEMREGFKAVMKGARPWRLVSVLDVLKLCSPC